MFVDYNFCQRCGVSEPIFHRNCSKKYKSSNDFKRQHELCSKKCQNCEKIFDDISVFNFHLVRCNIQSLKNEIHDPGSIPMFKIRMNSSKFKNHCSGKFDAYYLKTNFKLRLFKNSKIFKVAEIRNSIVEKMTFARVLHVRNA